MQRIRLKLRREVVRDLTRNELRAPMGGYDDTTDLLPSGTDNMTTLKTNLGCPASQCHMSCNSCPY
ncbi:MAG: hypothetical protein R3B81_19685 [bacterium]